METNENNAFADDDLLDAYRVSGTKVRIVRDAIEKNDVVGIVVAWDDDYVLIRRPNKRVIKIKRAYRIQPFSEPRFELTGVYGEFNDDEEL